MNLARLHSDIRGELQEAFDRVFDRSAFIGGEVEEFEAEFAMACGMADAAGCNSGTDALSLSLRVLGVGPGDEVVVPSMTFFATAEAVRHVGAQPVIADVDPDTLLLNAETVMRVVSKRTRAVIPVHLYGSVVDPQVIAGWLGEGYRVVEDAAQAHLAHFGGIPVGSAGEFTAYSFFPGKNLGAFGDGGAVVSDDDEAIARIRSIRNHGRTSKYEHSEVGLSSRLDGLQAAILRVKLRHLPQWTARRRELAAHYLTLLQSSARRVRVVPWTDGAVHHLLPVRIPAGLRDEARIALSAAGVDTGLHYPVPLSRQPGLGTNVAFTPNAELASRELMSVPLDPLMSYDDVEYVCEAIDTVLAKLGG